MLSQFGVLHLEDVESQNTMTESHLACLGGRTKVGLFLVTLS